MTPIKTNCSDFFRIQNGTSYQNLPLMTLSFRGQKIYLLARRPERSSASERLVFFAFCWFFLLLLLLLSYFVEFTHLILFHLFLFRSLFCLLLFLCPPFLFLYSYICLSVFTLSLSFFFALPFLSLSLPSRFGDTRLTHPHKHTPKHIHYSSSFIVHLYCTDFYSINYFAFTKC